jgi:2-polyprenyl-6-methoxyphenol hydroxylase-like FAD-dependent oxidoreductase
MVLVGDAFSTACPASGTGASKAMIDVERLCHAYIPEWLASGEIGPRQIARFYRDHEKRASDHHSRKVSIFARRIALEEGGLWSAYRWMRGAASRSRHFLPHPRGIAYPDAIDRPSTAH